MTQRTVNCSISGRKTCYLGFSCKEQCSEHLNITSIDKKVPCGHVYMCQAKKAIGFCLASFDAASYILDKFD